jgi:hypothetical protein
MGRLRGLSASFPFDKLRVQQLLMNRLWLRFVVFRV